MTGKYNLDSANQFKGVSNSDYIEQGGYTALLKKTVYVIFFMIIGFLLWSSLTMVNEVSVSFGEVIPLQEVHVVQHVQGGTIEKIFVKNGQEVEKGQALIKLDPNAIKEELEKSQSKELSLTLNAVRLNAFIARKTVDEVNWDEAIKNLSYDIVANQIQIQKSIAEDKNLLRQQNAERNNKLKIYNEKILQKKADLKQYTDTLGEIEKRLELYQKEEKMFDEVVGKGYVSRRAYLDAKRKTIEALAQLKQTKAKIEAANSAINEAEGELKNVNSELDKKASEDLDLIDAELLSLRHTILRLTDLNTRLLITAPITGIVKGLTQFPSGVISPAEKVMEIVPTGGKMIVRCRVSTKDIGHVKLGDKAHVKVMAFEFTRYGSVVGHVSNISASTFTNEKGLPYYEASISLEKNHVGDNARENRLKPGMTVQVDIITGQKSVLAYLTKPITRGLNSAFTER